MGAMQDLIKKTLTDQYRRETQKRMGSARRSSVAGSSSGGAAVSIAGQTFPASGVTGRAGSTVAVKNVGRIANARYVPDTATSPIYSYATAVASGGGGGGGTTYTAGNGIQILSAIIGVKLKTNSGLEVDSTGLAVAASLAGAGLGFDNTNKIMSVNVGDGLDVASDAVAVDVTDLIGQGLGEDGSNNLVVSLATADPGLQFISNKLALGVPTGSLAYASANAVSGASHSHAISSSFDTSAGVPSILRSSASGGLTLTTLGLNGNLSFIGGNRSVLASNDLILAPTGELFVDPVSNIVESPNDITWRSSLIQDLPVGIKGWDLFHRGGNENQLTITGIKADELFVRVFTADITRVEIGEEIWAKSRAILNENFIVPADEANVLIWVEGIPALPGFDVLENGDWLVARTIERGTGLTVQKIYFTVNGAKLADDTTADGTDIQQYSIKRKSGGLTGSTVHKGEVLLDFGVPTAGGILGQGQVYVNALANAGGPFIETLYFDSVLSDVPQFKVTARMGNLKNTVDFTIDSWGQAAGDDISKTPSGGFSGYAIDALQGARMFNTDITLYNGTLPTVMMTRTSGIALRNDDVTLFNDPLRFIAWYDDLGDQTSVPWTAIGSAHYNSGGGHIVRQLELFVDTLNDTSESLLVLRSRMDAATGLESVLTLSGSRTLSTGATGAYGELSTGEMRIGGRLKVGSVNLSAADIAILHVVESTTTVNKRAGLAIEQKSTGDAVLHWFLTTPVQYFSAGIDNSDVHDSWKLSASDSLGTSDFIIVDPVSGTVTINGLTSGSVATGLSAGDGITLAGSNISVDASVARTTTDIVAGSGLTGGGSIAADRTLSVLLISDSGLTVSGSGLGIATATAGAGLLMTSGVINAVALTTGGLQANVDSLQIKLPAISGLQTDTTGLWIKLDTNSGLALATTGLSIPTTTAGTGLLMTSGVINAVALSTGGLTANPDSLQIKLPATTAFSTDATGLLLAAGVAGAGLIFTGGLVANQQLAVGAGTGMTINADDVAVNQGFAFTWSAVHTFNAAPTINANLNFAGSRTITTTSASFDLTISPLRDLALAAGRDLYISAPAGSVLLPDAQELSTVTILDAPTQIKGVRLWDRGSNYHQLTMGAIKVDELYARVFTADEVRISRGEQFWSYGYGIVETDFVLPADEVNVNVWFENAPALAAANLFVVNDWILLQTIDWDTSLSIERVYFQVVALVTAGSVDGYRQQWTLKRKSGGTTGTTVKKGNTAVDFGQIGQGAIYLSALNSSGGPFIKMGNFTSVASDVPQFTYRSVTGNLNGTLGGGSLGYSTNVYGQAAGNNISLSPAAGFSGYSIDETRGLRLFNTELNIYTGATLALALSQSYGLRMLEDVAEGADSRRLIDWYDSLDPLGNRTGWIGTYANGVVAGDRWMTIARYVSGTQPGNMLLAVAEGTLSGTTQTSIWMAYDASTNLGLTRYFAPTNGHHFLGSNVRVSPGGYVAGAPPSPLHVYESTTATAATAGLTIEQDGTGDATLHWLLTGGTPYSMGIDNSAAGDPLVIAASADLATTPILTLTSTGFAASGNVDGDVSYTMGNRFFSTLSSDDTVSLNLTFWYNAAGAWGSGARLQAIKADHYNFLGNNDAHLAFSTTSNGVMGERIRILNTGNVGIGTETPGKLLDVAGDISLGTGVSSSLSNNADNGVLSFVGGLSTATGAYVALGGTTHLSDAVRGRIELVVNTANSAAGGTFNLLSYNGVSTFTSRMTMSRAGLFGFGDALTPTSKLHIYQNDTLTGTAGLTIEQDGTGDAVQHFVLAALTTWSAGVDNSLTGDPFVIAASLDLATSPKLAITTGGSLGIGALNPGVDIIGTVDLSSDRVLQVDGGSPTVLVRGTDDAFFDFITTNGALDEKWFRIHKTAGGGTNFYARSDASGIGKTLLSFDHSTGYIGVNNSAPAAQFDVVTTSASAIRTQVIGATSWQHLAWRRALGTAVAPTQVVDQTVIGSVAAFGYTSGGWPTTPSAEFRMQATQSHTSTARGTKLIAVVVKNGTTSQATAMDLGDDRQAFFPGVDAHTVAAAANVNVETTSGWLRRATSSIRFKTNVRDMADYESVFDSLRPITYQPAKGVGGQGRDWPGLIAEEVAAAGGELFVTYDKAGRIDYVMYDRVALLTVSEVQKLKKEIRELKRQIQSLM